MVMVEIDSNAILVKPMTTRKDREMQRAYKALLQRLKQVGITPRKHILDNEVSTAMKNMIKDKLLMQLELVPLHCHRRNAAKVAIRNFKTYFLSVLAGTSHDFPISLWDRPSPPANRNHTQSPPPIQRRPKCVRLRTPQRSLRLQQDATGPDGM